MSGAYEPTGVWQVAAAAREHEATFRALAVLLPALLGFAALLLWRRLARGSKQGGDHDMDSIPGPWRTSRAVLGNLLDLLRPDFHRKVLAWADEYGGIVRVKVLWHDGLLVTDPAALSAICGRGEGACDKAALVYTPINQMCTPRAHPNLLTSPADPRWKAVRKAVAASFSFHNIRKKYPLIRDRVNTLCEHLRAAGPSHSVDVDQAALKVTLDVIGLTGFGHDYGAVMLDATPREHLLRVLPRCFTEVMLRLANPLRALSPRMYKTGMKGVESFNSFQEGMKQLLRECLARPTPPGDDDMSIGAQLWRLYHLQQQDGAGALPLPLKASAAGHHHHRHHHNESGSSGDSGGSSNTPGSNSSSTLDSGSGSDRGSGGRSSDSAAAVASAEGGNGATAATATVAADATAAGNAAAVDQALLGPAPGPLQLFKLRAADLLQQLQGGTPEYAQLQPAVATAATAGGDGKQQQRQARRELLISAERILSEIGILFIEGFETTGHTTSWTLFNIATVPGVQQRVEQELAALGLLRGAAPAAAGGAAAAAIQARDAAAAAPAGDAEGAGGGGVAAAVAAEPEAPLTPKLVDSPSRSNLRKYAAAAAAGELPLDADIAAGGGDAADAAAAAAPAPPPVRAIEVDDLPKLRYLTACIKESMRMFPVVSVMSRVTPPGVTTRVGPYRVKPNTPVAIPLFAIHNTKHNWEAPEEFRPERWLDIPVEAWVTSSPTPSTVATAKATAATAKTSAAGASSPVSPLSPASSETTSQQELAAPAAAAAAPPLLAAQPSDSPSESGRHHSKHSAAGIAFMPFSEGPRNCVGQTLAKLEVVTLLARLLGEFRVELAPEMGGREGIRARESTHLTLQTRGTKGIRMTMHPRA